MHLHDASKQYANKFSPCLLLQESYRDETGTPRHRTILNLSKLPQALASVIIKQIKGKAMVDLREVTPEDNRNLGEVLTLKRLADRWGLMRSWRKS